MSGPLDLSRPGPPPFPPMESWDWTQHGPFKAAHESRHRSVYQMTQRLHRHPFLALFDGPDPNTTTDRRTSGKDEVAHSQEFVEAHRSRLASGDGQERELEAWTSLARVMLTSNEMLLVD